MQRIVHDPIHPWEWPHCRVPHANHPPTPAPYFSNRRYEPQYVAVAEGLRRFVFHGESGFPRVDGHEPGIRRNTHFGKHGAPSPPMGLIEHQQRRSISPGREHGIIRRGALIDRGRGVLADSPLHHPVTPHRPQDRANPRALDNRDMTFPVVEQTGIGHRPPGRDDEPSSCRQPAQRPLLEEAIELGGEMPNALDKDGHAPIAREVREHRDRQQHDPHDFDHVHQHLNHQPGGQSTERSNRGQRHGFC